MSTIQRQDQTRMSSSKGDYSPPDQTLPSHPYNLRPKSTTPGQPIVRRRVIRKTSVSICSEEAKPSLMDGVDLDHTKDVNSNLSQGNGHHTPQQLSLMLIITITSTITFLFGICADQHGPSISALYPLASGLGAPDLRASNSSPISLFFHIHQPIVQLTTTIKTVPGIATEIKQSLDNYQGNLSSAVYVPKRWAEACHGGDDPWRNWWDSPACDVGFTEYSKAERNDVWNLLSMMRQLEGVLGLSYPSITTNWYTLQYLESILDSCIKELGEEVHREPRDIANLYYGALKMDTDTTFEMHRMIQSLGVSLNRAHEYLDEAYVLTNRLGKFLQERLGITSDTYKVAVAELEWARQLLFHLEEQIRRRCDEIQAWEIAVKIIQGSKEVASLNLRIVTPISMGSRVLTNASMHGITCEERDIGMLKYGAVLPSQKEQYVALLLAKRGLRPLYLE